MKHIKKLLLAGLAAVVVIVVVVEQNHPFQFPPIPTSPLPVPNAYDYYTKASDGAKRDEATVKVPQSLVGYGYSGYPTQLQLEVLRVVAPDLKTMRAGFAFPFALPVDHNNPQFFSYAGFRELARLLQLQGLVDEKNGDWGGAADTYIDSIKLGVDIPHGGAIISQLVGVACESIGRKNLWTILPHLSDAQAQAAKMRLLAIEPNRATYANAQVQEKYDQQARFQVYFKPRDWANEIADAYTTSDGSGAPSTFDKLLFVWRMRIAGKRAIYNQYSVYQDAVIEAARQPYGAHARVKNVPVDPITAFEDAEYGTDPYAANQLGRGRVVDSQAQNELLIVSLALQQYHLKNHTYPKSLSELIPTYLSTIPADPYALSGPLRYIKFGATYCLYSVGPDTIDNHGAAIGSSGSSVRPYVEDDSKGDIVAGVNP